MRSSDHVNVKELPLPDALRLMGSKIPSIRAVKNRECSHHIKCAFAVPTGIVCVGGTALFSWCVLQIVVGSGVP